MSNARPHESQGKWKNFIGLLFGFSLGQGLLFLAHTWLLGSNRLEMLGLFGASFSVLVLAYHIVDLGGITILAREIQKNNAKESVDRLFWSGSIVRLLIALIIVVSCSILYFMGNDLGFVGCYAFSGSFGTPFYAFNGIGILDGLHRSRWSGISWSIPFVFSAIVLPLVSDISQTQAGLWLGGSFSLGAILSTGLNHHLLIKSSYAMNTLSLDRARAFFFLREGILYLLSWGAGQIFYRGQIAICATLLDIRLLGIFVYTKQVINAVNQILFFLRRTEFPCLVKVVQGSQKKQIFNGLMVHQASLIGSFAISFLMVASGVVLWQIGPDQFQEAGQALSALAITIPSASFYSTFNQICNASERLGIAAWCASVITIIGLGIQWVVVPHGWIALSLGEVVIHIIGLGLISFELFGVTRKFAVRKGQSL
jgi:O-antigen/teichoic acid export membrane protein